MAGSRRRVLVIDDEGGVVDLLVSAFEEAGFDVATASDALGAHVVLDDSGPIDLIVTDIRMPGQVDGVTFAQLIAQRHPDIPIIIMSGVTEPDDRDLPAGATFMAKPFRTAHLLDEAKLLLARGQ